MAHPFKREATRTFLVGLSLTLLFWIVDSVVDAYFENSSAMRQLFAPGTREMTIRSAGIVLLVAFLFICARTLASRRKLGEALEEARKMAEREKARSEAILADMGDGISIQDTDFRILYQNCAHKALKGDHVGEYCYTAYQGNESVCDGCHLATSFADGQTHFREASSVTDRGVQYVEIISTPLKDADGKIFAGIEAVRDVTPRKKMEEERKKSLAAIEAAMDGIAILDSDQRYIYVNEAHAKVYGYDSAAELLGKTWRMLYYEKEVAWFEEVAIPVLLERGGWRGEARGKRRDGSTFPQELSLTVSPDGYMVCVVRDITERKQAEEKIRELAGFLQRMIDTIPNPIFYKDARGLYLGCNKAFEAVVGLSRDEIVGKSVFEIAPIELPHPCHDMDMQLLANPGIQIYESQFPYHDGKLHDVIFTKATYSDADGKTAGLVGVMSDITEHNKAEEEIRKLNGDLLARTVELSATNKELEAFSYSLSHDLRTLLTQVFIAAQGLEEEYAASLDENGRFFATTIRRASESMEELLEAMLVLAGVTRSELSIGEVDLTQLADEIQAGLRMREPDREVELITAPGLVVHGDQHLLKVALENLLGNAWKYTRKTARARIELGVTDIAGEKVHFVRDNGAGFAMKDADKLFKPFKRLHKDEEFDGTGIGLATVQRIIDRHGGRIWAEGEVGQGATFYFTIK